MTPIELELPAVEPETLRQGGLKALLDAIPPIVWDHGVPHLKLMRENTEFVGKLEKGMDGGKASAVLTQPQDLSRDTARAHSVQIQEWGDQCHRAFIAAFNAQPKILAVYARQAVMQTLDAFDLVPGLPKQEDEQANAEYDRRLLQAYWMAERACAFANSLSDQVPLIRTCANKDRILSYPNRNPRLKLLLKSLPDTGNLRKLTELGAGMLAHFAEILDPPIETRKVTQFKKRRR